MRSSSGSRTGAPQQQVSTSGVQQGRGPYASGGIDRGDQPPNGYPSSRFTDPTTLAGRPLQPGYSLGPGNYENNIRFYFVL